jgi:AhpC/TSA antioxidant enzyme
MAPTKIALHALILAVASSIIFDSSGPLFQHTQAFTALTVTHHHPGHHRHHHKVASIETWPGQASIRTSTLLTSPSPLGEEKEEYEPTTAAAATTNTETKLSQIESLTVQTLDGKTVLLGDVLGQTQSSSSLSSSKPVVLSCLSHYGDYNAWELTQQYMTAIEQGRIDDTCPIVLVGIGSVDAARVFARDVGLINGEDDNVNEGRITLVTDETGQITDALGCYKGWLTIDQRHKERFQQTDIPPAVKLLGMIFGFGSPGTINKVLDGYVGDWNNNHGLFGRRWVVDALVRGGQKGFFPHVAIEAEEDLPLQPFELATLRLQSGLHIMTKWNKLGPKDGDLITRMGGTFVFADQQCIWEHFDQGILNFSNMDDISQVVNAAVEGTRYIPPSNKNLLSNSRRRFWEQKDAEARANAENQNRIANQRRVEEERLALEAKKAEEARLEEQSRQEEEAIIKVALQGQEAKQRRLEMAKNIQSIGMDEPVDNTTQSTEEITSFVTIDDTDVVYNSKDLVEDEDIEESLEAVILRAVEQERKIREALEAVTQSSEPAIADSSVDANEISVDSSSPDDGAFQRRLLAASLQYRTANRPRADRVKHSELSEEMEAVNGSTGREMQALQERFQQKLLATRLGYDSKNRDIDRRFGSEGAKIITDPPILDDPSGDCVPITHIHDELFHRNLLAARLRYEKTVTEKPCRGKESDASKANDDELFHRNFMAARLRYEEKSKASMQYEETYHDQDIHDIIQEEMASPQEAAIFPDSAML